MHQAILVSSLRARPAVATMSLMADAKRRGGVHAGVRVLLMTPYYAPNRGGGVSTYTTELAKALRSIGVRVAVWTPSATRVPNYTHDNTSLFGWRARMIFANINAMIWYGCSGRKSEFDVINVHEWHLSIAALGISRLSGKPLVLTKHGAPYIFEVNPDQYLRDLPILHRPLLGLCVHLDLLVMAKASRVIVVGTSLAEQLCSGLRERRGISIDDRLSIAPPGTPSRQERRPRQHGKTFRVVAVGRLILIKGFDILLRALQLLPTGLEVDVTIAGDGPELNRLEQMAWTLPRGVCLRFAGQLEEHQVMRLYDEADVTVIPSRVEGYGLIASEAQSRGCPVIASDVPGLREQIAHHKTGLIFGADNPTDLMENLVFAAKNREAIAEMAAAATLKLAQSGASWTKTGKLTLAVFEKALGSDVNIS